MANHQLNLSQIIQGLALLRMRRYFYEASPLIKNWLESQYNMARQQDKYFRDALLASINLSVCKNHDLQKAYIESLRQTVLDMTIEEQFKYSNNYHLEHLFAHLDALHRNTQGKNMVLKGSMSNIKDIVDPDKFPMWDLKQAKDIFYSRWQEIEGALRYDLGHQLVIGDSLVQHPSGGRGVFIVLKKQKVKILPGQLLGLVPGIVYNSYNNYAGLKLKKLASYERVPEHLHFPSGKILQLSNISIESLSKTVISHSDHDINPKLSRIQPQYINPYGLGHLINHPPPDKQPNVIFTEIQVPINFYPGFLKQPYLPYNYELAKEKSIKDQKIIVFAIVAAKQIKNYEELYVNYCQNHIYPIEEFPKWMIEPKAIQYVDFSKGSYENPTTSYWEWIERKALSKNKQLFDKYRTTVQRTPGKIVHEDKSKIIREMKVNSHFNEPN